MDFAVVEVSQNKSLAKKHQVGTKCKYFITAWKDER